MESALIVVALAWWLFIHVVPQYWCWQNGKTVTGLIGLVVPLVAMVGAWRLAKPDSRWALEHYGEVKMAEAMARYPDRMRNVPADWQPMVDDPLDEPEPVNPQDSAPWEDEDEMKLDKISRRARGQR